MLQQLDKKTPIRTKPSNVESIYITKEMARSYLDGGIENRDLKKNKIDLYRTDMNAGRWIECIGECIKFDTNNRMSDGFHRMEALILSDLPGLWFDVKRNVPANAFLVLDSGMPKTNRDAIKIAGIPNSKTLAPILVYFNKLQAKATNFSGGGHKLGKTETIAIASNEGHDWQSVIKKSQDWYEKSGRVVYPSIIGALYAHLCLLNTTACNRFMDLMFLDGICDIPYIINARLKLKNMTKESGGNERTESIRIIVSAWNLYRSNSTSSIIPSGKNKPFPIAN
jgi:hypothetical protein